ncbi:MAG: cbb3-type cytochrome c oxidase subunit I [bacterium]
MNAASAGTVSYLDGSGHSDRSDGLGGWLGSLDHKRIGLMYLAVILAAFLLGSSFALVLRTEMLSPARTVVDRGIFQKLFTMHGIVMLFLCVLPGIPAALGNFVLPLMLGAANLAYPRLNRLGFHFYLVGVGCVLLATLVGALDTGWTFLPPLSDQAGAPLVILAAGLHLLALSVVFTGLNFLVTIVWRRPAGMTWFRLPLLPWLLLATSILQIVTTPILAALALLLLAGQFTAGSLFGPTDGNDPLTYQHFFWFFAHAAIFLVILPGIGVVSEVLATFCRKPVFGYRQTAVAGLVLAALAPVAYGVHLIASGQSPEASTVFSLLALLTCVPATIIGFNLLATLYEGSIQPDTPLLYGLAFLMQVAVGGLSGLFLSSLATGVYLHGTYFQLANLHYLLAGGGLTGFLAGLYYWWPKLSGRLYNERWGKIGAGLIFFGFNLAFLTKFFLGSQGMLQRQYDYAEQFVSLQVLSSVGAYLLGFGLLIVAVNLIHAWLHGRPAPANPWGGVTLEWSCPSPPPAENFAEPPQVTDLYDFRGQTYDPESGGFVKAQEV